MKKTARQTFKIGDTVVYVKNPTITGRVTGFFRGDVYGIKVSRPGYGPYGYGVSEWIKLGQWAEKSFSASQQTTATSTPLLLGEMAVKTKIASEAPSGVRIEHPVLSAPQEIPATSTEISGWLSSGWLRLKSFCRGIASK